MIRILLSLLIGLALCACGAGISDYSERLSGEFYYWNEGEGLNSVDNADGTIAISYVKKYDDDGKYISVWQADSAELNRLTKKSSVFFKRNTYYPSDRFYIINIEKQLLTGPLKAEEFFAKARELNIVVSWKPHVISEK